MELGIQLCNITKSFDKLEVLKDLSITFTQGITALIAPTGSGKTTLLRIIAGLERPDFGAVQPPQQKISMVFQEDRLLPTLTAIENVSLPLDKGDKTGEIWLDNLGLASFANSFPHELSGGMSRRVALARALAFSGEILLLDEPFKGLDRESRLDVMEKVRETAKDKVTILVTHDAEEAVFCADRVLVLDGPPLTVKGELEIGMSFRQRSLNNEVVESLQKRLIAMM